MENSNEVMKVGEVVETIKTVETNSNDIKTVEMAGNESTPIENEETEKGESGNTEPLVPILEPSDIQLLRIPIDYIKGLPVFSSQAVRYADIDGQILVCGYDFLNVVFVQTQLYNQLAGLKILGVDAESENGGKLDKYYFSLKKINAKSMAFDIAPAKYSANPENFAPYVHFMVNGGMNRIAELLGIEANFGHPKDLSKLGINEAEFSMQSSLKVSTLEGEKDLQPENIKVVESKETAVPEKQPENTIPIQPTITDKRLLELSAKIEKQSKNIEGFLNAFELNKAAVEGNFKQIESAFNGLKEQQSNFSEVGELFLKMQMQFESNLNALNAKIETVEKKDTEIQTVSSGKEQPNRLKKLLTDQSVWMYLAMVVTAIFLPFTIMGLYKHIHISTDTWYSALSVGFLCCAIAFVWDMAIFFFAINGKKGMAAFGSLVQVVFFSAKFNLIAILAQDGLGLVGEYWQNLTCIIFAVIYSPLLLANLTHLSTSKSE